MVVAAAAAGIAVWATAASGATDYQTATATIATVEKTLTVPGTADPVDQATADFQVPGTVAAVDVTAGQSVTAGQTLASLDTTTLQQAVTSAEITLNADKAKLTEDEAAEAASTTTTTTAPTTTTTTTPAKGSGTLQQAQQAVVNAQQTVDTATQRAGAALAQAQTACGSASTSGTTTTTTTAPTAGSTTSGTSTAAKGSTGTAPSGTAPSGTAPSGSAPSGSAPSGSATTCAAALNAALADQEQVSTDQKAVATAESSLAQLLAASGSGSPAASGGTGASGTQKPTASSTTTTTRPASGGSSPGGTSNGPGSSSSATGSAAQLASDQAAIDTATASLIEAQQSLVSAQLTSPIAGTVVSVALAAGQTVTAGSTTDAITVISAGSFEVTASVTSTQAAELKVGDPAEVTVNGTTGALQGTVARVGPADTSGSSITYPVVVALSAGAHDIRSGSAAEAVVVVRRAEDVLAVPTSAVHTDGTGSSYVTVLRAGQPVRKPVTVGIVGSIYTQISGGMAKGATVVLADPSAPLPSASTSGTTSGLPGSGVAPVSIHFSRGP